MSVTEILDELPRLSLEERQLLFKKLNELETEPSEVTTEMLAAIDEAEAAPHENDLPAEDLRLNVTRWARTK